MKLFKRIFVVFAAIALFLVGCGKDDNKDTRTDAQKVDDAITFVSQQWTAGKYASSGVTTDFDLVNKKDGVTISYVSNNTDYVAIAEDNSKAIVTRDPNTDQIAVITATFTLNSESKTKDFGVLVKAGVNVGKVTITEALALADETAVIIEATVIRVDIAWDAGYGNMSVTIADGDNFENTLYVYRTKTLVEVNDHVIVTGTITSYNGARQIAAGSTMEILGKGSYVPPQIKKVTITEALAEADGTQVEVTGTVIRIDTPWNDGYGNISVTIADGDNYENELYIYRLSTKVEVKDNITVTGYMATYNGNRQIAQGATAVINGKDDNYNPVVAKECTIAEALAEEDGVLVKVTGKVVSIDTEWSDSYGNISVTIADTENPDSKVYVYRLATNVGLNDVITVTGYTGTHEGTRQIVSGTAEIITKGEVTPDEPENPGTEEPTPSEPTLVTAPVVGTEYLLGMDHTTLGDTYYFTGAMSGFYFATSTNPEEAVKVVLEAGTTEGSYYAYFVDSTNTKQYLNVTQEVKEDKTYNNVGFSTDVKSEFTFNSEYNTLLTNLAGTNYFFGSRGDKEYTTLSACAEQYLAENFIACLYTAPTSDGTTDEPENPGTEEPNPDQPGTEEPNPDSSSIVLTDTVLGLGAYADGTKEVNGYEFQYIELGTYGNGIQWRNKTKTSTLWNNDEFAASITSIELVYNASQANYSNSNALKVEFSNNADFSDAEVKYVSTVKGQTTPYTVTPTGTYKYVRFTINITYSLYFDNITINF